MPTYPPAFYTQHGPMTDAGPYAHLLDPLPADPAELAPIIHGLMAADLWRTMGVLQVPTERGQEANIRSLQSKLRWLMAHDDRPLTVARPFEERLIGNCRDLSLLLCAMLRHQGVPARLRVGFDTMDPAHHHDHQIVEYWRADEGRWARADLWMDQIVYQKDLLPSPARGWVENNDLHTLDHLPGQFVTGGEAWQDCRAGGDAMTYGIEGDLWGLWFVRDNLQRDLVALNRIEMLPWDCWGIVTNDRHDAYSSEELARLDAMAALTVAADEHLDEIIALYARTPGLHVPPEKAQE